MSANPVPTNTEVSPDKNVDSLMTWLRPIGKRSLDLLASTILILLALPVLIIILVMVSLDGGWPIFGHLRVGYNGKEFNCLKFRTMCNDAETVLIDLLAKDSAAKAEWEASHKLRCDPRVTAVGRILRMTSLDELPQLFNVICGQMSLVGPRPVTKSELKKFYGPVEMDAYMSVRPGITGLWQVSGRSEVDYSTRVALDTAYCSRPSLRRDVIILIQTVDVLLRRGGAW